MHVVRRRPPPPSRDDAYRILALPKTVGMSAPELLEEARKRAGAGFGSRSSDPPWQADVWLDQHGRVRARLMVGGVPILGLDHHLRESMDGLGGWIPPGYHWDVHPPLADSARKICVEPQPRDPDEALELLVAVWYLQLDPEPNRRLRLPR